VKKMDQYECMTCRRSATIEEDEKTPLCCGKPMKKTVPREICLQPAQSEHARPMEDENACDEFRAGV
jgi:hypothetical protein